MLEKLVVVKVYGLNYKNLHLYKKIIKMSES